jgi:glycosyltransferase 2 family protein
VNARSGRLFRILVAAVLTLYLLWRSDPAAVLRAAANADLSWIVAAVLLVLADRTLMAQRWIALLCIVEGQRPPLRRLIEIFLTSTFIGTFLPASIGGDAVRAYSLSRDAVSGGDAVASVFMDRMLGVASLLLMGIIGLVLARDLASNTAVLTALAATGALCVVTILMVFSEHVSRWGARLVSVVPAARLQRVGHALIESVRRYARYHSQLFTVLVSSVAVQVLRIVQAYCLGRSLGIDLGLTAYFAFIPLILLVMLLPVTINGLGTGQLAFVWFFAQAGVSAAPSFALSVLFIGLGIVGNIPGALIYALKTAPAPATRPEEGIRR